MLDPLVRLVRVLHATIGITEPRPEQERAIPAGAGYAAKAIEDQADNKRARTLEDLEWDSDVWQLVKWDGQ